MTQIWWSFLFISNLNDIEKISDIKQYGTIDFLFLAEYRIDLMHRFLDNKISGHYLYAHAQPVALNWFTTLMVQCIHQTQDSLVYQMTILFNEHVIYVLKSESHPDNLVCRSDPLDWGVSYKNSCHDILQCT